MDIKDLALHYSSLTSAGKEPNYSIFIRMISIHSISRLCISLFVSIFFLEACNSKAGKPDSFSSEVLNVKSDTDIIGTEFKEGAHIDRDIKWNDSSYKNAYLINDNIYVDFESIRPFINSSTSNSNFSLI